MNKANEVGNLSQVTQTTQSSKPEGDGGRRMEGETAESLSQLFNVELEPTGEGVDITPAPATSPVPAAVNLPEGKPTPAASPVPVPNVGPLPDWISVLDVEASTGKVRAKALLSKYRMDKAITAIRDAESYNETDDDLMDLAKSLNKNGSLRMDTDLKAVYEPGASELTLIGGNRRMTAAMAALNAGTFKDVPVYCIIFPLDQKFEVAARDNAFRKQLNEMEAYRQIVELDKRGTPMADMVSATGMGDDTIRRYLSISKFPVLVTMLENGMPYTKLARIVKEFKDKKKLVIDQTITFLDHWYTVKVPKRREAKQKEAAKRQKTASPESLTLGKMLNTGEFDGWIRDLHGGTCPTGKVKRVSVAADLKGNLLRVTGFSIDLDDYTENELGSLYADIKVDVLNQIKKAMKIKKAQVEADEESDNDEEKLKVIEDLGIHSHLSTEESDPSPPDDDNDAEGDDPTVAFDEDAG